MTAPCEFPDWRMGFVELDGIDVSLLPGFSNFLVDEVEPRRDFIEKNAKYVRNLDV